LTVAYIDPFWDGTLQMILTNSTSSTQRIRLLETIAQCFFFDLATPADARFREEFPRKSHHFGQTWRKVLDEDAEPFPQKKRQHGTLSGVQRVRAVAAGLWLVHGGWIKGLGLTALVATALFESGRMSSRVAELESFKRDTSDILPLLGKDASYGLPGLKQSLDDLRARLPISGTRAVSVPAGATRGEVEFRVQKNLTASRTLWVQPEAPNDDAVARVLIDSISGDQVDLRITVAIPSPAKQKSSVNVRWLLIP